MTRECPICGSQSTGGSPKSWKNYTERGRLDIDYMRCDVCHAAWDNHRYVREEVNEVHDIRRGDGNLISWGEMPAPTCKCCKSEDVRWLYEDGRWHEPGVGILRYECKHCGEIWLEMARDDTGERVAWRTFRRGVVPQKVNPDAL